MSKHALPVDDDGAVSKRARFTIDGLLESAKAIEPASPSCSESSEKPETEEPTLPAVGNWPVLGTSVRMAAVECRLEGRELWAKFFELSTEMIITKSGRRMFPTVKVRLEGCDPDALYYVFLDVVPVDDRRYRYVYNKSSWLTAGKAEPAPESRLYMHPDSPFPGRQLASQVISFEKAKLTNNDVDRTGHLVLNSMHKYQPRVHVVRRDKSQPLQCSRVDLGRETYKSFQFTETQFMAVTAYQNQLITKLKIEKNPFAKGFRDPSGRSTEIELERHLERLPRFPFGGIVNPAAAAAAALMFGHFPLTAAGLPPPPPTGPPPAEWLFANLAAAAALNPMTPKFPLPGFLGPQGIATSKATPLLALREPDAHALRHEENVDVVNDNKESDD